MGPMRAEGLHSLGGTQTEDNTVALNCTECLPLPGHNSPPLENVSKSDKKNCNADCSIELWKYMIIITMKNIEGIAN